jgi:hypothetical protein
VDPHHFDADPDSTYHPDADPDADSDFFRIRLSTVMRMRIRIQILASKRLKSFKSAKIGSYAVHFGLTSAN